MATSELFARVAETPAVQSLARRLEKGGVLSCAAVSAAAQPFLAAVLRYRFPQRPIVVVTEGLKTQETVHQDLATWLQVAGCRLQVDRPPATCNLQPATSNPLFYPSWEVLPGDARLPHADVISERLETLVALTQRASRNAPHGPSPSHHQSAVPDPQSPTIVTSVVALLQRTFPCQTLSDRTRTVTPGDQLNPLDLVEWLESQGYEPEAQVTQKGELALRGGILDVFPPTSPWPARIEFLGDAVESLRHFDPLTQISREEIGAITIPPAGELSLLRKAGGSAAEGEPKLEAPNSSPRPAALPRHPCLGTLLDYLPPDAMLLLCEPEPLAERAEEYAAQVPENDPFFISWEQFQQQAVAKGMTILESAEAEPTTIADPYDAATEAPSTAAPPQPSLVPPPPFDPDTLHSAIGTLNLESLDAFRPLADRAPEPQVAEAQRREFFAQLHRWLRQGFAVHVFCNNDGERQRFTEIWNEYGLSDHPGQAPHVRGSPQHSTPDTRPSTHLGTLARGFLCEEAKVVVVTDAEIFGRYRVQRPRRLKSPHAQAARSVLDIDFAELEEGDYVVHLQHGIGRYTGLQVLPAGAGRKQADGTIGPETGAPAQAEGTGAARTPVLRGQECLVIEYAATDPDQPSPKLYVPVTEAHLVSKYVGSGKARPPLNTLGGTRWSRAKAQAERAVRDVASDLLAIQAARESQPGHAFAPDAPWQREFESAFIYEETPDQLHAITETKTDMERAKPMDRLICGDVGFGKTEVAIRAAFKAVMDGRQVAVLVPTTVLAQQHFNTFRERMADYPVRIELLSRFRTRRDQVRVLRALAAGGVDIVIGTHRLLQDDIAFKDLALVVVDEEQRFGVMHKEKFKMLRRLVDVLTLSATPIPRTLYLALSGARDMSTIQTPPHDRLPVETIVTQYDERLIREAIQRELNRGGQVFFLHNRVMTIDTMAQKLRTLLPHARIVVGHGQMHSDDLEEVMTQFVNGAADVLLSTTIIESGLDIPNANTIIIDRADRFGLSDLYQLRGRVGRYKHQAYAYLLLPRHGGLLTDVRKRLSAIKQYSTLGSGFKIAMRDLEIRGAGNLLGAEQSGHITAVGFELYCQLLKQSIATLKGEKVKPRVEVQVRLDFLALSPTAENPKTDSRKPKEVGKPKTEAEDQVLTAAAASQPPIASSPPRGMKPTPHFPRPSTLDPQPASACIPFNYISDSRQRIELYRKLAQATDPAALADLRKELRDRFGPVPPSLGLLLQVGELKILAARRGVTALEVRDDKLMLTRHNDYVMIGSKFPRLTESQAPARLKEIRKLLLAL